MVFSFFFFFSTRTVFLSLSAILPLSLDATNHFSEINDASSESLHIAVYHPIPFLSSPTRSLGAIAVYTHRIPLLLYLTKHVLNKYNHPLQLSLRALFEPQFSVSIFQRQRVTTIFSKLQFRKVHQNIVGLAPLDDRRRHPRPWWFFPNHII